MPDLMTATQAMEYLKISRSTLHRLVKQGRLTAVRISSRAIRFTREDLDKLIEESRTTKGD